jgi:hypothetical protein
MKEFRYNRVLLAIILISLVCGLWLVYSRHQVEVRNDTVEMAMDYQALRRIADWEGQSESSVLSKFKDAGITSLVVYDATLERLDKDGVIVAIPGKDLLRLKNESMSSGVFKQLLNRGNLDYDAVYIAEGSSKTAFSEVITDLRLRYGVNRISIVGNNPVIIELKGDPRELTLEDYVNKAPLMQAPLGLSSKEMKRVQAAGFKVIVRPQNYLPVTRQAIDSIFARIATAGVKVTAYLPCGTDVVGYPNNEYYMSRLLHDYDIRLGLIEHVTQLQYAKFNGLNDLLEENNYDAVRVYTIDQLENSKLTMPEAMRRWSISDEERNIRLNYIRPFMKPQAGQDILELNLDYVRGITASVEKTGYKIGTATLLQKTGPTTSTNSFAGPYFPPRIALCVLAFGIFAALAVYLSLLVDLSEKKQLLLTIIGGFLGALLIYLARGLFTRQLLAFMAAVIFPALSMNVIMDLWDSCKEKSKGLPAILFTATWQLALAIVISLIGATFIASILGDNRFFLEADIYRGVKLTFIMPPLLTALLFIKRYNMFGVAEGKTLNFWQQIRELAKVKITAGHLLVLAVLAVVAIIFVGRSGHSAGIPVPALEIKLRVLLEHLMYARPREKEFLIGHPAFYLAVYAAYNKWPKVLQLLLVMAASIGQGSLVQTFCHVRTPVIMSYVRAGDGFVLGAVLGIILLIVVVLLLPYFKKWQRSYLADE